MSHLPQCLHTVVPLFLLSVILGLLPALLMACPGSAFLLLGLINVMWGRLGWAQPLAPWERCPCRLVGWELGLSPAGPPAGPQQAVTS